MRPVRAVWFRLRVPLDRRLRPAQPGRRGRLERLRCALPTTRQPTGALLVFVSKEFDACRSAGSDGSEAEPPILRSAPQAAPLGVLVFVVAAPPFVRLGLRVAR